MDEKVTISLQAYTELLSQAIDCKLLKRFLREKSKSYGRIDYSELQDLCILFDLTGEGEDE